MATKRLAPSTRSRSRSLIGDNATGQVEDGKDEAAASMGRKGGKARAKAMTPERRAEIAKRAAAKRWLKDDA